LDTQEDFQVIKKLLEAMYAMGKGLTYRLDDIVNYFLSHPEVLELNASIGQRKLPIGVDTHLEWGKLVKHGRCSA
jgi:spore coat polysaccharide biosynthesis protein SpsF (cytidylyltransferase family)